MTAPISIHNVFADDPRKEVRAAVLRTLELRAPEDHGLILDALLSQQPQLQRVAVEVLLYHYPWLRLLPAYQMPMPSRDTWWAGLGDDYQKLFGALVGWIAADHPVLPAESPVWREVPLLRRMFGWAMRRLGRDSCGAGYLELRDVPSLLDTSRQALFVLTYGCNLDCSYCYALKWHRLKPTVMSPEDRRWALDWCVKNRVGSLILAGGEPTTYPHLEDFVVECRDRGIGLHLASNGIFGQRIRDLLRPDCLREFIAHYDQEYFARQGARVTEFRLNLERTQQTGLPVRMRYTITGTSDRRDWMPMLEMAQATGVRTINFAFAFENFFGDNHSFTSDWRAINGHRMEDLLDLFLSDLEERGLVAHSSKPLPLCGVSAAMLRRLGGSEGLRTPCSITWQDFTRNLTINPDLSTLPCHAIFKPGPSLREVEDLEELGRVYQPSIESWMKVPAWRQCSDCPLHYAGVCQPSCIARQAALEITPTGTV